jgi:hypothetical protein
MTDWERAVADLVAACHRTSAETGGKAVRPYLPKEDRLTLAGIEGALAQVEALRRSASGRA